MGKVEFLEQLLDELEEVYTLEEAKELISEKLDEAYSDRDYAQSLADMSDIDDEDF